MNKDFFLSAEFYLVFKAAFGLRHNFSAEAEDASSFACLKLLRKVASGATFEDEKQVYKYLWKTAERKMEYDLTEQGKYSDLSILKKELFTEDLTRELDDLIEFMINHLSEKNAEVVKLIHEGYTEKEIAEELHVKENTIRQRYHEIVKKFRGGKKF